MADTQNSEEPTYPMKRKPDLNGEDSEEHSKKAQKLETFDNNSLASADKIEECEATPKSKNNLEVSNSNCSSVTEKKIEGIVSEVVAKETSNEDDGDGDEVDDDEEGDNGDEDEDEDEDEDVHVDRKGKGIVRDDKGKGKLEEEEGKDEDDTGDDDSSDDGVVSDGDSDLSDDPLAEVDLNNILPSRTRRRTINPGVYIANDLPNDEDDDSDDSDA